MTYYIAKANTESLSEATLDYMGDLPKSREQAISGALEAGYERSEFKVYEITDEQLENFILNAKRIL